MKNVRASSRITAIICSFFVCLFAAQLVLAAPAKTPLDRQVEIPAYKIGPGDVLIVSVWKEEGLEKEVLIRPDGGMSFPLAGDLKAGGKSVAELTDLLVKKISRYIPDPVVTVSVRQIQNNKIFVVGKVNRPGEYVATHYVDVMQALAMAGGLNAYASSNNIKILRRVNGKVQSMPFEYGDVSSGDNLEQNIILESGDVVVVP